MKELLVHKDDRKLISQIMWLNKQCGTAKHIGAKKVFIQNIEEVKDQLSSHGLYILGMIHKKLNAGA